MEKEKTINEYCILIKGKTNIPVPIDDEGKDIEIILKVDVDDIQYSNNHDGTFDKIYKVKASSAAIKQ